MPNLFKINTNISALRALNRLQDINQKIVQTSEKISTGKTVNRASDDPATYYISRLYESSISKLVAGQVEIDRGIDFLEKNNSRLDQVASSIIEMTDLVNTANSGSITSAEQQAISKEIKLLVDEVDNILSSGVSTKIFGAHNGVTIGNLSSVSVSGGTLANAMTTASLNIEATDIIVTGTTAQFTTSLSNLSDALTKVLGAEETVGSWVKRLTFERSDKSVTELANRASLSTIVDADLAEQQVKLSSYQILQNTSLVGLVQANTAPSAVLNLVRA